MRVRPFNCFGEMLDPLLFIRTLPDPLIHFSEFSNKEKIKISKVPEKVANVIDKRYSGRILVSAFFLNIIQSLLELLFKFFLKVVI